LKRERERERERESGEREDAPSNILHGIRFRNISASFPNHNSQFHFVMGVSAGGRDLRKGSMWKIDLPLLSLLHLTSMATGWEVKGV
jgi:hypothetical protein